MLCKPTFFNAAEGILQEISPTQDSVALAQVTLNGSDGVGVDMQGQRLLNLPSPTGPAEPATKAYADSVTPLSSTRASVTADIHIASDALSAGDPVYWSATAGTLARGDAASEAQAAIVGVAIASAGANTPTVIVKRGVAQGVLQGATPGQPVYLAQGGGAAFTTPSDPGLRLVRLGWAVTDTDLEVLIADLGST